MIVYLARDIPAFLIYCVYGESRSSLLIESTDSIIGGSTLLCANSSKWLTQVLLFLPFPLRLLLSPLVAAANVIGQLIVCPVYTCVKYRRPCSSCLPGDLERCQNRPRPSPASSSSVAAPASQASAVSQPSPPSSSSPSPPSSSSPSPPSHSPSLPSLESIFHMRLSTLRYVPKACRDTWARVVGEVFQGINSDPCNPDPWVSFFMLARCILASPPRGGRSHWRDIQRRVKQRLAKWRDGQIMELWEDILDENNRLNARLSQKRSTPSPFSNIHRARLAAEDGQYRKALQALSSVGIARRCWKP